MILVYAKANIVELRVRGSVEVATSRKFMRYTALSGGKELH